MTPNELTEGNKLIAAFVGKDLYDHKPWMPESMKSTGLEYHKNWSWLMYVIGVISDHRYPEFYGKRGKTEDDGDWDDTAYLRTFGMRDKEGNYMVRFNASRLFSAPTLIEATWLAVIDFIQWFNTQSINDGKEDK